MRCRNGCREFLRGAQNANFNARRCPFKRHQPVVIYEMILVSSRSTGVCLSFEIEKESASISSVQRASPCECQFTAEAVLRFTKMKRNDDEVRPFFPFEGTLSSRLAIEVLRSNYHQGPTSVFSRPGNKCRVCAITRSGTYRESYHTVLHVSEIQ